MIDFQGSGKALSTAGLSSAAGIVGTSEAELWTVVAVETSGCGFLPDRRPQILFERHIFYRLTNGQFDDGDISDPAPGGYGMRGAHQYDRLGRAAQKDRDAALQSASWGIGQILGKNFSLSGFADVESMVAAMSDSEDDQLSAMSRFIQGTRLDRCLQAHDWPGFARGYNGPNYATNQYDKKLSEAYQRFSTRGGPDLNVRAVQLYLTYLGFDPGGVDGVVGPRTRSAVSAFFAGQNAAPPANIDATVLAKVESALPPIS